MGDAIEKSTGCRPDSCPWRAYYSPLVSEAIKVAALANAGHGSGAFGEDPPAILYDATAMYTRVRDSVVNRDSESDRKERERNLKK